MKRRHMLAEGLALFAAFTVAAGCGGPSPKGDAKGKGGTDAHAHGEGPHGGVVADWGGGKYHVEFTVDHDKQEATVYILGSNEKTAVPIKAKDGQLLLSIKEPAFQVPLKAAPQPKDPEGKASRFAGKHEKLGKVQEFAGTISGEVDGTPYAGDFEEEPEGHDHKHPKK
jgi:hypothetical protein